MRGKLLWIAGIVLMAFVWMFVGIYVEHLGFAACGNCPVRPMGYLDVGYLVMTGVLVVWLCVTIVIKGGPA
jgi:hypothetical protein